MANHSLAYGIIFLMVIALVAGVYTGVIPVKLPTTNSLSCGANTHFDTASGQCVADSTGGGTVPGKVLYSGTVDWTVTSKDGDSKAALALTSAVFWVMHKDGTSYAGTATQATNSHIRMDSSDNGQAVLCVLYLTMTVGFVDPAKTLSGNPSYMTGGYYLKDVNTDGKLDQCYPVNVQSDTNFWTTQGSGPPQQNPAIFIDLIAWNDDHTVTVTNISSPTGMNTAGDYHSTGYIAAITSTYEMNVVRLDLDVQQSAHGALNSTAGGLWSLLQAQSTYIVGFSLIGVGGQGGHYGRSWASGEFAKAYDTGSQEIEFFRAADPNDATKVDITQPNYGIGFVNERLSGTTWLQFDIWIHTGGDLTASSKYYAHLNVNAEAPTGTITTNSLTLTWTG